MCTSQCSLLAYSTQPACSCKYPDSEFIPVAAPHLCSAGAANATLGAMRNLTWPVLFFAFAFMLSMGEAAAQEAPPEQPLQITADGAWCWFADPRAIVQGDQLLVGWVDSKGDIVISSFPDGRAPAASTTVLHAKLHQDDHANPALLPLPDGRLMAFYSRHTGQQMLLRETLSAGDFRQWSEERVLPLNDSSLARQSGDLTTYTYPNPVYLAKTQTIAMTWRGMNWKPTISFSTDLGKTWSPGKILLSEAAERPSNRPYVKVASDGQGRMHFLATDGHPRNEATNSVYHFYYETGAFFRMDGTQIATIDSLPVRPEDCDVVYDGNAEGVRAWVWDLALDSAGNPVAVYTRLPREDAHEYRYAHWNGKRFVDRRICTAGKWFPQTPEGKREPEPHYSGGVVLDHNDPRHVIVSRPRDASFQIEQWTTQDGGNHWSTRRLTHAKGDHVRPTVARGTFQGSTPVLWMHNRKYTDYQHFDSAIEAALVDDRPYSAALQKEAIGRVARDVAQWQLDEGPGFAIQDWPVAPFLVGLLAVTRAGIGDYAPAVTAFADSVDWKLGRRPLMADDHAIGQAYLELYLQNPEEKRLSACRDLGNAMLALPFDEALTWENGIHDREWAWCDSLFMAPPMLALLSEATGDAEYRALMNRLWWKTTNYLYSPEYGLYFRDSRFFERKEPNGKPVFWSRGNGWVFAGLARVLMHLPADDPARPRFEKLFRDMAATLRTLQREDGYWSAGLLDSKAYPLPETSGSAFFCFGFAYGIRAGLLPQEDYLPALKKGWAALVQAVDRSGRLGWVQPVSDRPKIIQASDSSVYAIGGFLLTASELFQLSDF